MTEISQNVESKHVSAAVLRPLGQVASRQWVLLVARGAMQTLCVGLSVWLGAALLLGWAGAMPVVLRIALAGVAWGSLLFAAGHFLRPALRRRDLSRVARQVEAQMPGTHELLSSAVELSAETDGRFRGSEQLLAAVYRQAEQAAAHVKPEALVSMRSLSRWGLVLAPVALAWLIAIPMAPRRVIGGLYRVIVPWRSTLPPALAMVRVTPGDVVLPEGDPLTISAEVADQAGRDAQVRHATLVRRSVNGSTITSLLERTGDRSFLTILDRVDQDMRYQVSTDQGDSGWHTVTVRPRPIISSIDLRTTYPAYTGLPVRVQSSADGAIEALAGSSVQVTIHVNHPLADRSRLIVNDGTPEKQEIALSGAGQTDYAATVPVAKSGAYRIDLVNEHGIHNKDGGMVRKITAVPDAPPGVTIASPAATTKVRPDDVVPVTFKASDDFAVAKVEAIVQVDGQSAETFDVPAARGQTASGQWQLSVPYHLERKKIATAQQITYQLKVTDNRDPNPQTALSSKQFLQIDQTLNESYATRADAQGAAKMVEAITKAIAELTKAEKQIEPLKQIDAMRTLAARERVATRQVKDSVATIGQDLARAAGDNFDGPFANIAAEARQVTDEHIRAAAEQVGRALLDADQPEARQRDYAEAGQSVADAKKKLEALVKQAVEQLKQHELAKALVLAAQEQKALAAKMAEDPAKNVPLVPKQQELNSKLAALMAKNPRLVTPEAQQIAQKLAETARAVSEVADEQTQLEKQVGKETHVKAAAEKVNDLADEQRDLNRKIEKLNRERAEVAKQAQAALPQAPQTEAIAQKLDAGQLPQAEAEQKAAAQQLARAAEQLNKRAQAAATPPQQAEQKQIEQAIQQAKELDKQAEALQKEIAKARQEAQVAAEKQAKANPQAPKPADPTALSPAQQQQVNAKAQQIAAGLQQQLAPLKADDADQQTQVDGVKADIAKAQEELGKNNPAAAQKKLDEAAGKLQGVHEKRLESAKSQQQEDKKDAGEAAGEAKALAQQQVELAKKTAEAQKELAAAQALEPKQPMAIDPAQQQALPRMQAAEQQARQLEQLAKDKAPEIAGRAHEAAEAIKKAAEAQQQAAASHQQSAQEGQKATQAEQQAKAQYHQSAALAQQAAQHRAAKQTVEAGQKQYQAVQASKQGEQLHKQAEASEEAAMKQQHAAEDRQQAAAKQAAAAEHAIRGLPEEDAADLAQGAEHDVPPPADASAQGEKQPMADADRGKAMAQAAAHLQEARLAQDEAVATRKDRAADEAAAALAKASRAIQRMMPGGESSKAGQKEGNKPGQDALAQKPGQFRANAQSNNSKGIDANSIPNADVRPTAVKELGIPASDWAKLPPLAQQQLLTAAQQAGPPEYQEMIKNYYIRIARLQAERAGEGK